MLTLMHKPLIADGPFQLYRREGMLSAELYFESGYFSLELELELEL